VNWVYWSLLSAVFAALTALFAKLGVKGIDANLATAIRTSIVTVLTWALVASRPIARAELQSGSIWLYLVLSGCATGLSWLCYFHALQTGPLSRVAPVDKLSVVLTVALGALVLGESVSKQTIAGTLLIMAGVLAVATDN
jgi:transporter family protein